MQCIHRGCSYRMCNCCPYAQTWLFLPVLSRQEPVRCQTKRSSHDHTHKPYVQCRAHTVTGNSSWMGNVRVLSWIEFASDRYTEIDFEKHFALQSYLQHWQLWHVSQSTRTGSRNSPSVETQYRSVDHWSFPESDLKFCRSLTSNFTGNFENLSAAHPCMWNAIGSV